MSMLHINEGKHTQKQKLPASLYQNTGTDQNWIIINYPNHQMILKYTKHILTSMVQGFSIWTAIAFFTWKKAFPLG